MSQVRLVLMTLCFEGERLTNCATLAWMGEVDHLDIVYTQRSLRDRCFRGASIYDIRGHS